MRHKKAIGYIFLVLLVLMALPSVAHAQDPLPEETGFMNDFANVCSAEQAGSIENKLTALEADTGIKVAVATINSCGDDSQQYRYDLFKKWGIGKAEKNNGLLILVCIQERKLEQETGFGLEGTLPDLLTAKAAQSEFIPPAKEDRFCQGLENLVSYYDPILRGDVEVHLEAAETEPEIGSAVARQNYNNAVTSARNYCKRIPGNIFCGLAGYSAEDWVYFEASKEAQDNPDLNFGVEDQE